MLPLRYDEARALHQMMVALMHAWGEVPDSEARTQAVGSLAMLRVLIERVIRLHAGRSAKS